jgi:predicted ATPase
MELGPALKVRNMTESQLRADCLRSLSKYFCEANRTCQLLLAVKKFLASFQERQAIVDQRQIENAAFHDYYSARAKLVEVAYCDGFFDAPDASQASPIAARLRC